MGIKGYKVFNSDWTCRGFQYEVGKTFKHNGNIEMCGAGFHFCQKANDCFDYYQFDSKNKVAEVEAIGLVETRANKSVTDEIKIIREIEWQELLMIVNTGKDCTGLNNSGNRNSGDCNSGNRNSGFFNSTNAPLKAFNKSSKLSFEEYKHQKGMSVIDRNFESSWWIFSSNMTDEEKEKHPEHKTTGGYLKTVDYKTAWQIMWNNLDDDEKQSICELDNFNAEVFKQITGIEVEE